MSITSATKFLLVFLVSIFVGMFIEHKITENIYQNIHQSILREIFSKDNLYASNYMNIGEQKIKECGNPRPEIQRRILTKIILPLHATYISYGSLEANAAAQNLAINMSALKRMQYLFTSRDTKEMRSVKEFTVKSFRSVDLPEVNNIAICLAARAEKF